MSTAAHVAVGAASVFRSTNQRMDHGSERRLRDELRSLVRSLAARDLVAFQQHLDASPDLITAAREQKIILKVDPEMRSDVAAAMVQAAERTTGSAQGALLSRHLELMTLIAARSANLQAAADALVAGLPAMSLADLLRTAQKAFDRFAQSFTDRDKQWYDPDRPVGLVEREWHDFNGRIADVISATCRAVNLAAVRRDDRRKLRDHQRGAAERAMVRIVSLCSVLNGLDWVRDSTAFGDLDVTSIEDGDTPAVTLQFCDPRRSLLRTLGIRREIVMESFARRPERFLTKWLNHNSYREIANAVDRYLATVRDPAKRHIDLGVADRSAKMHLNSLDFEDDMVVMASEGDLSVMGYYLLSSMLQWSEIAAHAVARSLPKNARRIFLPAPIYLADLTADVAEPDWPRALAKGWAEATVQLPMANHWDLVRSPFVRSSDGVALPLLHGATGKWNASIRERLLRGGALAKRAGAVWERYFADRFREAGWKVIGEGVRLRQAKQILTDIDLLVVKNDLLLVIQVKTLGGAALNPYDHWRYRKVIEKGCWQAGLARSHLANDLSLVQAVVGRRVTDAIRRVEPAVLTNLGLFDGWEHNGVPVLAETLLKSITVGSRVDYIDPLKNRVIRTRHLLRAEDLNTDTIVDALRRPIELAIAPETGTVEHIDKQVADILFRIPQFAVPDVELAQA